MPVDCIHVLCTRTFTAAQLDSLRAISPRLMVEQHTVGSRAELTAMLGPDVEVLFSSLAPESLSSVPRLRWLQSRGAGVNQFVGTPIWGSDVIITTASGLHAIPIGEYVLGMMVALARDFLGYLDFQRRSRWPMTPKNHVEQFPGRELRGATVLIIGYGSIGREVARLCSAFGMRVLAIKRDDNGQHDAGYIFEGTGDPTGTIPETLAGTVRLNELLPKAEFVVVATASTPGTRHLIGEQQFLRMRRDAFLINIARGDVIDEAALILALQERRIAGAALDVFEREPLPADSPLWRLDNIILSPHVAGLTPRYDEHVLKIFAENLRRYVDGRPLLNVVDRAIGY